MTAEARFAAMGSHAHVLVSGATTERTAAELVDMATQRIEQLESLWSRFGQRTQPAPIGTRS